MLIILFLEYNFFLNYTLEIIFEEFDNLFIWFFWFFFIDNIYALEDEESEEKFNFNSDILYKYFVVFLKTPNFLINFSKNWFNKFYLYTVFFKHKISMDGKKIFFSRYFNKISVIWRPLFKRTSYFGYYRSNRSRWIK